MIRSRPMLLCLILVTSVVAFASPGSAAQRVDEVSVVGEDGTTVTVTGTRRGRTPAGGKGFVGVLRSEVVDPPDAGNHGGSIGIYLDVDGDDDPEFHIAETQPSGMPVLLRNEQWGIDSNAADLSYQRCVDGEWSGGAVTWHYDPDCLGAGPQMRIAAVVYGTEDVYPVGEPETWSEPVATPSKPWRYCARHFGPIQQGQADVELGAEAVSKMTCRQGERVIDRARRAFDRKDKRAVQVGRFRCTDPNGIGASITCRHQDEPRQRWVQHWFLP